MVDGLLANVGSGIVLPFLSSSPHPQHWVPKMVEFLDEVIATTRASSVDLQKHFPVVQVDSMFQVLTGNV